MFTIRQKIVNELKSEINWRIFEVGVFSRGVPTNQVLFTSCIDICLSCLQVGTRCHLFTSWYTFFAWSFVYKYTLSFVYKYTLSFVYKLLQCPSSSCINTFGNDVVRHNATTAPPQKGARKSYYILLTWNRISYQINTDKRKLHFDK